MQQTIWTAGDVTRCQGTPLKSKVKTGDLGGGYLPGDLLVRQVIVIVEIQSSVKSQCTSVERYIYSLCPSIPG